ncbi:helix-turn-helix transcriptional regulator [Novosphingobium aerophilum]|uniref:Helix-turn-helix transcriptional regulator n=1 Tax=Novosphingobium aerophilum TaxID=2839843 RepID=A0A7X1F4R6_9SPHN|nr:helix-turn-helix transcriptional regulator [Novosphingobium aerophilum]MBC2650229.1 helix-turn-helix transcriptional regulator [Novosphingobium aerophilum]
MPIDRVAPDTRHLVDLLFAGLAERPIWTRFRAELARVSGAGGVALVIRGGTGADETAVIGGEDGSGSGHGPPLPDLVALEGMGELAPQRIVGTGRGGPALGLRVPLPDGMSAWLVLEAPAAPKGWDELGVMDLLAALAPDLSRALPLYGVIAQPERARLVAEYVLEASGIGVVVVTADGTVLSANATARTIMARTDLLRLRDGRLVASTSADQAALRAAVAAMARAQAPRLDPACHCSVALADPVGAARLTLIVRPGPPYWPVSAPLRRTAVVIVRDPAQPATLPPGDLAALFGLTAAEARLATRLADGEGLDEAALALGITRNTARSQLQAIFAKTGVNRQGDLVRVLLGSAANHVGPGGEG